MDTKALGRVEIKDDAKGTVKAVFSTFDVVDHDGDVTAPGAIQDGASVRISAYGHASWGGALPVGKGVVRVKGNEAILEGQFFMDTTHGRDTFETVKQLSEDGLQEWSYGFDVLDAEPIERDGQRVRLLKRLKVHEVSPVLLGAGIGTRTLAMKGQDLVTSMAGRVPAVKRAIPAHDTPTVARSWDAAGTVAALPEDARPSQLRTVYAWVDPDGDPEAKSSYKFPHHHGIGGPANIRACLAGIAVLNGARGGADISDGEREAVYKHLAGHLQDADREPPELRTATGGGTRKNLRFGDEASDVMASVSGLIDRATEVVALRARKGRGMSPVTADLLSWIGDDLKRLQRLLEHPIEDDQPTVSEDEIASTFMAAVARVNGL